MASLALEIAELDMKGETLLLSVYFSGHGLEDANGTLMILNDNEQKSGSKVYPSHLFNLE